MEIIGREYKSEKKITASILAILLGNFGIHKFYLGYNKAGIIHLILGFLCGLGWIIGVIEGVIYLTKTDEGFDNTYVKNIKEWF